MITSGTYRFAAKSFSRRRHRLASAMMLLSVVTSGSLGLAASPAYRSGTVDNINWEVRFNHLTPSGPAMVCQVQDRKPGAFCDGSETKEAAKVSGVEDRLIEIMNMPEIRSVSLAYYSFSNSRIKRALCEAAQKKDLHLRIYIDGSPENVSSVEELRSCSKNVVIQPVGLGFGRYIQHMKIFFASEMEDPRPLSQLTSEEAKQYAKSKAFAVSSSGNMSSYGTSLHFDNWLFLESEY